MYGDTVDTVNILGVNVHICSLMQGVDAICNYAGQPRASFHVVTANSEMIYMAYTNPHLLEIINTAGLVTADGMGVVVAARMHGVKMPERVAGYDLWVALCAKAAQCHLRVYLLGGRPGVADQAAQHLQEAYPDLQIVGVQHGYYGAKDEQSILESIKAAQPHILGVALGVPRQEMWIAKHQRELGVPVAMGIGGSLDVLAGHTARAPTWMQRLGLEWAYRLIKQPQRAGRMLALPKFALLVTLGRMKGKKRDAH